MRAHTLVYTHTETRSNTPPPTAAARAGTPIQNNMRELFGIMSLLDPERWDDEVEFLERFGGAPGADPPSLAQVRFVFCEGGGGVRVYGCFGV